MDYRVSSFVTNKGNEINPYQLKREYEKFFGLENKPKKGAQSKPQKVQVHIPNFTVLGFAVGQNPVIVIKVGGKTLIVDTKKENNGWKLIKIENQKAVLSYKGNLVEVNLSKLTVKQPKNAKISIRKTQNEEGIKTIPRKLIDQLTQNYGALLTKIDFVPYIVNGKTMGFKIRWLAQDSIFKKLGLKVGDVILSINGYQLTDVQKVFEVIQILRNENTIRVEILRNGQRLELKYRID